MSIKNRKALSLIELITALSVAALVLWVMVNAFIVGSDLFRNEKNTSDLSVETTRAIELMTKEIRNGREISSAGAHTFTFWYQDMNDNGSKEASEIVTYSWDGSVDGNLIRTCDGTSKTISKYVKNFTLTYDSATVSYIKKVTINLITGIEGQLATLESTATLRNL